MVNTITDGVKVSIETLYQQEYSNPANEHFMFAYKVNIENMTDYAVQLMRRHWHIFDSNGTHREVEGEGVVGLQPVIEPGNQHEYVSGCNLKTEMGTMKGEYQMLRLLDNHQFDVQIPEFQLVAPYKLN
ncbi:Co2+/Mg2+ efflux protein ApaG [uncultured Mucilaginibacter sp.]|uniref:Co2+/Mg2+ efflux protein ApaG n=1 Tax=uncultured Mucilaginibacter sp. TaxID=797541 RepID=UPI00263749C9|nr:Co2+/Mg2+ efflux protein ApaG [uncultured Mucilaginibacter sp.]